MISMSVVVVVSVPCVVCGGWCLVLGAWCLCVVCLVSVEGAWLVFFFMGISIPLTRFFP